MTKGAFQRPPQRLTVDLSLPQLAEAFIVDGTNVPGSQVVIKYFRTKQDQGLDDPVRIPNCSKSSKTGVQGAVGFV